MYKKTESKTGEGKSKIMLDLTPQIAEDMDGHVHCFIL